MKKLFKVFKRVLILAVLIVVALFISRWMGFNFGKGIIPQLDNATDMVKQQFQKDSNIAVEIKGNEIFFNGQKMTLDNLEQEVEKIKTEEKIIKLRLKDAKQDTYYKVKTLLENKGFVIIEE